jgi:hypothetical protein
MHRPSSTLEKHFVFLSSILIYKWPSNRQGLVLQEGLGELIQFSYLTLFRTRDLPACNIVHKPLRYRVPHIHLYAYTVCGSGCILSGYSCFMCSSETFIM